MRTGEPPEAAEPTLVIPDNPGGLFSPGRSILEGVCASVRGSYGENAIRGTGVTPPRGSQPASGPRQCKSSRSFSVLVDSTGHAAHPLRGAQGAGAGVGIAHAMPLSCTPGGWIVDGMAFAARFLSGSMRTLASCTKPGSTQPLHPKSAPGQNLLAIYGTLPEQPPALSAPPWSTDCCWGSLSGMLRTIGKEVG